MEEKRLTVQETVGQRFRISANVASRVQGSCTFADATYTTIVDKSPCVRTEVWRKRCYILYKRVAVPPALQHNVENQLKLHVLVFNIVWGVGGEVRQVKLYSRLACTQKRQKCKFVLRLLSMIVGWLARDKFAWPPWRTEQIPIAFRFFVLIHFVSSNSSEIILVDCFFSQSDKDKEFLWLSLRNPNVFCEDLRHSSCVRNLV